MGSTRFLGVSVASSAPVGVVGLPFKRLGEKELRILLALRDRSPRYVSAIYEEICGAKRSEAESCYATVRKSIRILIEKGLVYRKREKGTLKFMIGLTREGKKLLLEFAPREW